MGAQPMARGWTYAEFARLPSDGQRREIIAGDLYVTPAPRPLHQRVVARLVILLENFAATHGLGSIYPGPIDVLFAEGDYLEPDLVFVRRERQGIVSDRGIEGPPDLVVEIVSEATAGRDRDIKRRRYAHFGVPEYWIVDPDAHTVEVYRFTLDAETPAIVKDVLRWTPMPAGPTLECTVREITAPDAF
ncbi:MAG: Uma2 family endonuclease [Gemmatimonadota bacterium]